MNNPDILQNAETKESNTPAIVPPIYFIVSIAAMILLNSFAAIGRWLYAPWRYFGILVILMGFMLTLANLKLFLKLGTPPRPGLRAKKLVTDGAFRFSRNPMYLGFITMLAGVAILLGSFSPLFVIPVFALILHSGFVLREEKWMEKWFGDSYLEYKKKTPRWI